jgi:hypothetical protein
LHGIEKEKISDHMIPAVFLFLESLPSTNGKVDRTALHRPDRGRPNLEQIYPSPQDDAEKRLAPLLEEILSVRPISIYDNFFDLGGHSPEATPAISLVVQTSQLELAAT